MTEAKTPPPPVSLFFGLLVSDASLFEPVEALLAREYSPILERSETIPFNQTDYYMEEMGGPILRRWIAVQWLMDPADLATIKTHTNRIEKVWGEVVQGEMRRRVNIDPGYLDLSRVVLASCKDHSHRLYLGQGVYGELTLNYKRATQAYEPLPWTYADYQTPAARDFFQRVRGSHRERAEAWHPVIEPPK